MCTVIITELEDAIGLDAPGSQEYRTYSLDVNGMDSLGKTVGGTNGQFPGAGKDGKIPYV